MGLHCVAKMGVHSGGLQAFCLNEALLVVLCGRAVFDGLI